MFSTVPSERGYHDVHGAYQLPNDSVEHERLDDQSKSIIALMNGKPFYAPLTGKPQKIVDIGCGTGTMTALLGSIYPDAQVIGVDIAATPPLHKDLPNVEFVQGDIRELIKDGKDPRFQAGSFDYVFERLVMLGMTDWPEYIKTISSLVKPGGWVEVQEGSMQMLSPQRERLSDTRWFYPLFRSDAEALGLDLEVGPKLKGYFTANSLENVREEVFQIPPISLAHRPELDGFGAKLLPLLIMLMSKVSSDRRSQEELAKMVEDLKAMFAMEGVEKNWFEMFALVGQK